MDLRNLADARQIPGLADLLPTARKYFEKCKSVGDRLTILKMKLAGQEVAKKFTDEVEMALKNESMEEEDKKGVEAMGKVKIDLEQLLKDVDDFLRAGFRKHHQIRDSRHFSERDHVINITEGASGIRLPQGRTRLFGSLPLEHFMESTSQSNQRKITFASLALVQARRPDFQLFNELLVQYPLPKSTKFGQVVPDNMVVNPTSSRH